jgi:hypothetical protein
VFGSLSQLVLGLPFARPRSINDPCTPAFSSIGRLMSPFLHHAIGATRDIHLLWLAQAHAYISLSSLLRNLVGAPDLGTRLTVGPCSCSSASHFLVAIHPPAGATMIMIHNAFLHSKSCLCIAPP